MNQAMPDKMPDYFEQIKPLGSGYFASVTAFKDKRDNSKIALKRLLNKHIGNIDYENRFAREIEFTLKLTNTNGVIDIIETEESGNYYTMPLADENLYSYIQINNQKLDEQERVGIVQKIYETMTESHAIGILHRDLSPSNILCFHNEDGVELNIADFGLGKSTGQLKGMQTNSSAANYGQIYYVAPEQKEKLKQATTRSDVYSLGKLTDFIMTGRTPDNAGRHVLSTISDKATQYDPDFRFSDADDLLNEFHRLHTVLYGSPGTVTYGIGELSDAVEEENWPAVHTTLTTFTYDGAPYDSYIRPVTDFFEDIETREKYALAIGDLFDDAAVRYVNEVQSLYGMVGWPFNKSTNFHSIMAWMFTKAIRPSTRKTLFMKIWTEAFVSDQWGTQDTMQNLLSTVEIDRPMQVELGVAISESGGEYLKTSVLNSCKEGPIKNSISQLLSAR